MLDSGSPEMIEPAGGDGTDVLVDRSNANRTVGEYADGVMYTTEDGGHTFADPISPGFSRGLATNFGGTWHTVTTPELPNRFIAGVTVDPTDPHATPLSAIHKAHAG